MVTLEQTSRGDVGSPFDGSGDPNRPPTSGAPIIPPQQLYPGLPSPTPAPPILSPSAFNLQPIQDALPDHNPYRLLQKQRTGQSEGSYPGQTSYLSTSAGAVTGHSISSSYLPPPSLQTLGHSPGPGYHASAPRSHSVSEIGPVFTHPPQPVFPRPPQPVSAAQDGVFQMDADKPTTSADPFAGDTQPPQGTNADWWESPVSSPGSSSSPANQLSLEEQLENEFHRGRGAIANLGPPQASFQQPAQQPAQQQSPQYPITQPSPFQQQPLQQPLQQGFTQPLQQLTPQPIQSDPFGPPAHIPTELQPPHPPKVPQKEPQQSLLDIDDRQTGTDKEAVQDPSAAPIPVSSEPTAQNATSSVPASIPQETYQIKHVRFLDPATNKLIQSSILIQNENGPCPLIALVNVLSLSRETLVLAEGLRIRETLSLELLLNVVCEELVLTGSWTGDLSELFKFLMNLRTGMNVNPKFVTDDISADDFLRSRNVQESRSLPQPKPGDFEQTRELILYSAFNIPLVHGWLPAPTSPMFPVLVQHARDFEKAQDVIIQQQFILEKGSKGEPVSQEDSEIVAKAHEIQEFLESTGTQLTSYGLNVLQTKLPPGSWSIFFRNDHFSTLYKHPRSGELYTLVTDSGYATYEEIVWESLVDGTGRGGEYFSGDFRPVGHGHGHGNNNVHHQQSGNILDPNSGDGGWQPVQNRRSSRQQGAPPGLSGQRRPVQSLIPPETAPIVPPDTTGDTTDYDLALAIHLQQEEEERAARIQQNRTNLNPSRIQNLTTANQPPSRNVVSSQPVTTTGVRPSSSSNYRPTQPPRPTGRQAQELRAAANNNSGSGEEIPPPYAAADPNPTAFLPPADAPGPGGLTRHSSFPTHGATSGIGNFSRSDQGSAYSQMNTLHGQTSGTQYPGAARGRRSSGHLPAGVPQEEDKKCSIM
ncbi:hypothetical protein ABW20_dc0105984 [Dactylellina cionopaga]|nr:hypothetical protein ABW20_dc0105984 [Dactylellina cionopaga]